MIGFLTGVLVSIFSKTLVLLTGIAIVVVQASFYFAGMEPKHERRVTNEATGRWTQRD